MIVLVKLEWQEGGSGSKLDGRDEVGKGERDENKRIVKNKWVTIIMKTKRKTNGTLFE